MKKTKVLRKDRSTNFDYYLNRPVAHNHTHIEQHAGVELIELDASDSSESYDEANSLDHKHAWSYIDRNQMQMDKDISKINKKARENRRMKNRVCPGLADPECLSYENNNESDHIYTGFYNHRFRTEARDRTLPNNPINCFTMIQNELPDSESSSDKENGNEIIQCGDVVLERNYWNNNSIYSKNRNKCEELDKSKRTIWIYSFKNKNQLYEDNINPNNVFNDDDSSVSSSENCDYEKVRNKTKQEFRVPTPVLPMFKPRLNVYVAATLPTVTEIAEPTQFSSDKVEIINSISKPLLNSNSPQSEVRHSNSSKLASNNQDDKYLRSESVPHCVVNRLGLSPRGKRRYRVMPKVMEENASNKEITKNYQNDIIVTSKNTLFNSVVNNVTYFANTSDRNSSESELHMTYIKNKEETRGEIISTKRSNEQFQIDEKGDYNKFKQTKKPKIRLGHIIKNKIISDPIEKLEGDGWIGIKVENKEESAFELDDKEADEDCSKPKKFARCAGDRLLSKNMSLLKPVEWSEFLPITESIPSLHLSFQSDINENESWFKRIIKCFLCCKKSSNK